MFLLSTPLRNAPKFKDVLLSLEVCETIELDDAAKSRDVVL